MLDDGLPLLRKPIQPAVQEVPKMKKLIAIALTAFVASVAQAEKPKFYAEAGYTFVNYEESFDGDIYKSSPKVVRLIGGVELSKNLAIEASIGFNGGSDSVNYIGYDFSDAQVKISSIYGFYIKPKVELAPNFELFGRLGYTNASATVSFVGYGSEEASDSDFSYGVGATYSIDPKVSINVDYMSYLNKTGYSAKGFSVGLGYKF